MWNLLLPLLYQSLWKPVMFGHRAHTLRSHQRGCILPLEHSARKRGRRRQSSSPLPASQPGSSGEKPLVLSIMARLATPSCCDGCIVLLECKDAKEWMPPGLLRATPSSIPSCLPEHSLLLGQSCSTWECPFLSLPLPKVYQQRTRKNHEQHMYTK